MTSGMRPLLTHRFALSDAKRAYDFFTERRDGVLKVALVPDDCGAEQLDEYC